MRWPLLLVVLAACEPRHESSPAAASGVDASPPARRKSPRTVGCRERTMRLSESMCAYKGLWLPAPDATPDALAVVAVDGITVDVCLRAWEQLAKRCDGGQP